MHLPATHGYCNEIGSQAEAPTNPQPPSTPPPSPPLQLAGRSAGEEGPGGCRGGGLSAQPSFRLGSVDNPPASERMNAVVLLLMKHAVSTALRGGVGCSRAELSIN